jgi:hypothetical protein
LTNNQTTSANTSSTAVQNSTNKTITTIVSPETLVPQPAIEYFTELKVVRVDVLW